MSFLKQSPGNQKIHLINNMKMLIDDKDSLGLSSDNAFEPLETQWVKNLISTGDIVLDIGANIGYYSLLFSSLVGEKGQVYAFEPESSNYKLLEKNLQLNNITNVKTFQKGVSDKNATGILYLCEDNKGMHRAYPSLLCGDGVDIDLVRLDSFFEQNAIQFNFIKMDIEGYEYLALKGMQKLIKNSQKLNLLMEFSPSSMVECGHDPIKCIELLENYSFTIYALGEELSLININELKEQLILLKKTTRNLIAELNQNSQNYTNENITMMAIERSQKSGYLRPIIENFVCIKDTN